MIYILTLLLLAFVFSRIYHIRQPILMKKFEKANLKPLRTTSIIPRLIVASIYLIVLYVIYFNINKNNDMRSNAIFALLALSYVLFNIYSYYKTK